LAAWTGTITDLTHHANTILFDHDPITLKLCLDIKQNPRLLIKRGLYFKANPQVLNNKLNVEELKSAWNEPINSEDMYTRFHVAKERMRIRYKKIQKQTPKLTRRLNLLQTELENLKYSIQDSTTIQEITSLKSTTALIRDLEFTRAFRRTRRSKLKYLALGDSSTKYFFNCIKKKQQQETLNELQLATGNIYNYK
jgi:hypothetical protein